MFFERILKERTDISNPIRIPHELLIPTFEDLCGKKDYGTYCLLTILSLSMSMYNK